jgi:hypothetical protein
MTGNDFKWLADKIELFFPAELQEQAIILLASEETAEKSRLSSKHARGRPPLQPEPNNGRALASFSARSQNRSRNRLVPVSRWKQQLDPTID